MAHLLELRSRLVKCAIALALTTGFCLLFVNQEVDILVSRAAPHNLQALKPTEAFVAYIQVAFYTGIALAMPILVYQLFRFLAPGLTKMERRWILISLPAVTFFFALGLVFCYVLVLPSALDFLLNFGSSAIEIQPTISEFLSFVTHFFLAVGLAFELPVIIFILSKLGIATPKRLSKFRRWSIVLAFVIAAIITPTPDPINQTYVAIPLIILYEIGVLFARLGARGSASKTRP
jgi:sec-independent protein translocase protein TatC